MRIVLGFLLCCFCCVWDRSMFRWLFIFGTSVEHRKIQRETASATQRKKTEGEKERNEIKMRRLFKCNLWMKSFFFKRQVSSYYSSTFQKLHCYNSGVELFSPVFCVLLLATNRRQNLLFKRRKVLAKTASMLCATIFNSKVIKYLLSFLLISL